MMSTQNYGGIDVGKRNFVIALTSQNKTKTETNNRKGIQYAIAYLKEHQAELVVLESTGGLEIPLAKALYAAGIRVIIVNPRQSSQFAKSRALAKTDIKDAKMLALYAQMLALQTDEVETQLYIPPSAEEELLEALVNRRTQLVEMRAAEKNRLEQVHSSQVASVSALIRHFDGLIKALDKEIDEHSDTHFGGKSELLQRVKGVGGVTSATLIAKLPELGKLSHKRIASLVGVAPHPQESGTLKWQSRCNGGRSEVRKALYMAALVASRFEPRIKAFYQRLCAKGKPFKVAINACMHKLLTILNAMVRDSLREKRSTAM